jgi:hypothetical protein
MIWLRGAMSNATCQSEKNRGFPPVSLNEARQKSGSGAGTHESQFDSETGTAPNTRYQETLCLPWHAFIRAYEVVTVPNPCAFGP